MSDDESEVETRTQSEGNCFMGCMNVSNDRRHVSAACGCRRNRASAVILGVFGWFLNTVTLGADCYKYYTVAMMNDYGIFISKSNNVNNLIFAFCIVGGVLYMIGFVLMIVQWRHCRHRQVSDAANLPPSTKTTDGIVYTFRIIVNFLSVLLEELPICIIYWMYIVPCTLYWTDWIHLGAIAVTPFCLIVKIILCLFLVSCACSNPAQPKEAKKVKKDKKKNPKIRIEMDEDEEEVVKYDETAYYKCSAMSLGCVGFFYLCVVTVVCSLGIMVLRTVIPNYVAADWLYVTDRPEEDYRLHIYTSADFNGSYIYTDIPPQPFRGDTESSPSTVPIFDVRAITPNMTDVEQEVIVPCQDLVAVAELGATPFACLPGSCSVKVIFGYRQNQERALVYDYEEVNSWRCTSSVHQNLSRSQKVKDYRYTAKNIMKIDFQKSSWSGCLDPEHDTTLIA